MGGREGGVVIGGREGEREGERERGREGGVIMGGRVIFINE